MKLASCLSDKKTASRYFPKVGNGASHEEVDQQQHMVVAALDPLKAATSCHLFRTVRASSIHAHLLHQHLSLTNGFTI